MLARRHDLVRARSQIVIATHSPLRLTRAFLADPERFVAALTE